MRQKTAKTLTWIIAFVLVVFVLPALWGAICSLVYSTPEQKLLKKENRALSQAIPLIKKKLDSLEVELAYLRSCDSIVFKTVFDAPVPSPDGVSDELLTDEMVLDQDLCEINSARAAKACERAARIEENWRTINDSLKTRRNFLPPLISPIEDLTHKNVGASTGTRINPFYKVAFNHEGLDIVAADSTLVFSTCRGWVTQVQRSPAGGGNMVEISHPGGYITRYAHLEEVFVKLNDYVDAHRCIGTVGNSGRSFTTHLHYEVGTEISVYDPCQYLFGSVDPKEYFNILITSASSGQTLD